MENVVVVTNMWREVNKEIGGAELAREDILKKTGPGQGSYNAASRKLQVGPQYHSAVAQLQKQEQEMRMLQEKTHLQCIHDKET